jgi:RNA polymerase sigma-70 factor (ECF subfamily)
MGSAALRITDFQQPSSGAGDAMARAYQVIRRAVAKICPEELSGQEADLVRAAILRVLELQKRATADQPRCASYFWKVAFTTVIDELRRSKRSQAAAMLQAERLSFEPCWKRKDSLRHC